MPDETMHPEVAAGVDPAEIEAQGGDTDVSNTAPGPGEPGDPASAEQVRKRDTTGKYVVLVGGDMREAEPGVVATWEVVGTVMASGQTAAKRMVLDHDANSHLRLAAETAEGLHMVAVPLASWQPTVAQLVQPPAKLKV